MADRTDKPAQVTVETLKAHTTAGESYDVGDTYDVPEDAVDNLVNQGMAVRTDRVAVAKEQRQAAAKAEKARGKTAVEPMTIDTSRATRPIGARKARVAKAPKSPRKASKR